MKLFGVDFSKRYIIFKVDDKDALVAFDESFFKGIHNVEVFIDHKPKQIELKNTYPRFNRRIQEAVLLTKIELKHMINCITKCKS